MMLNIPHGADDRVVNVLRRAGRPLSMVELMAAGGGSQSVLDRILPVLVREHRITVANAGNGRGFFIRFYSAVPE